MKKLAAIGVAWCMLGQVVVQVKAAPNARNDGWKFARSAPVKQAMKKVMGDKYPLLEQNTQLLNDIARPPEIPQ